MSHTQIVVFVASLVLCSDAAFAAPSKSVRFSNAVEEATKNRQTAAGQQYQARVNVAMADVMATGMRECLPRQITRDAAFKLVFFVAADGRVQ